MPADERNFPHLHFEFLQPDRIRDAQKRNPDDPQYDPKTLYVPDSFLCKQTPVCVIACFLLEEDVGVFAKALAYNIAGKLPYIY